MSAICALVQRDAAHLMTDSLMYIDGEVTETRFRKCLPLKGMRAAIAATGPSMFGYLLAEMIERNCATFDDVVKKDREWWRGAFDWFVENVRGGKSEYATVVLIGWLERESRPACFSIELSNGGSEAERIARNSTHIDPASIAHDLMELPILANPSPSLEELQSAGWPIGVDRDKRDAETDLLHMLEIQRRKQMDDGKFYVGGQAILTTVTRGGVEQRVVHTWPEDKVGRPIRPRPIDWVAWRAERSGVKLSGLSRLQRERMLKKARKGTLRALAHAS